MQRKGREQLQTESSNCISTKGTESHLMTKLRSSEVKTFSQGPKTCLSELGDRSPGSGSDCLRGDRGGPGPASEGARLGGVGRHSGMAQPA